MTEMTDTIVRAWHFVGDALRDGRPVPKDGEWLVHDGDVKICDSGLHASRHPFDALQYAPGPVLCLVECRGIVEEHADKFVCRERRIVVRCDATEGLRYFARMQALSVIHLWDREPPDVVLDYLMTGDESARVVARDAALAESSAAMDAAIDAAMWNAAMDAARNAARAAAIYAARAAAKDAAMWNAARAAAKDAAMWNAAMDAARNAARAAMWNAARSDFNALVEEAFREHLYQGAR